MDSLLKRDERILSCIIIVLGVVMCAAGLWMITITAQYPQNNNQECLYGNVD